jgi:hypothetical protein
MNKLKECSHNLVPENQQNSDNTGEGGGDGHHLVRPAIQRDQVKMHEFSVT